MIPTKLKDDAIIEALCQLQFDTSELGELVLGRLSDFPDASSYTATQLPIANIPAPLRRSDPNLRFQPILQLSTTDGRRVQMGERVLATHAVGVAMYPGWEQFRGRLTTIFDPLFKKVRGVRIEKATLRYINALVPSRHLVNSLHDLQLRLLIDGEEFVGEINVNLMREDGPSHIITTRVASTGFVQGQLPLGTVAVVDVEITSTSGTDLSTWNEVLNWIEQAHTLEKNAFFRLFPESIKQQLREE